jgi:hypothetical protein
MIQNIGNHSFDCTGLLKWNWQHFSNMNSYSNLFIYTTRNFLRSEQLNMVFFILSWNVWEWQSKACVNILNQYGVRKRPCVWTIKGAFTYSPLKKNRSQSSWIKWNNTFFFVFTLHLPLNEDSALLPVHFTSPILWSSSSLSSHCLQSNQCLFPTFTQCTQFFFQDKPFHQKVLSRS